MTSPIRVISDLHFLQLVLALAGFHFLKPESRQFCKVRNLKSTARHALKVGLIQ